MKNILYYSVNYTKVNFASTSLMNNVVKTQQQERELWSKDRLSNRKSKLFFCRVKSSSGKLQPIYLSVTSMIKVRFFKIG